MVDWKTRVGCIYIHYIQYIHTAYLQYIDTAYSTRWKVSVISCFYTKSHPIHFRVLQ